MTQDEAANALFVEAVELWHRAEQQLWSRAEHEPVVERAAMLQRVQSNLKAIIERHPGSALAVRWRGSLLLSAAGDRRDGRAVRGTFRDCPECPEMLVIPAGATRLASGLDVTIAAPFAVGRFTVTFEEWDACHAAGGSLHLPDDRGWGRGRRPVINVSWHDAQDYVAWLSKRTGKAYRLLSEAEWEYAAQAGTGREAVAAARANEAEDNAIDSRWDGGPHFGRQTAPVGSFPPNAFGLHDMHRPVAHDAAGQGYPPNAFGFHHLGVSPETIRTMLAKFGFHDMLGNVWEWTADCWANGNANAPSDGSPRITVECSRRVLRGGSWLYDPRLARSADRSGDTSGGRIVSVGFRVARTL
jgi:formylglycine-generating enzyme required for sulfatase activity